MGTEPPPQKGSPQFSADVYCGQTAAWIKMPLGTEVGLSPDDIVLDGDPAFPPQQGPERPSPIFGPCLLWLNGRMDQNVTWFGGKPRPRRRCVRWGPSPRPQKRGGTLSLIVGPFLLWPNGCMHQDATLYEGRPQPRDFVLDGNPATSPQWEPPILWSNGRMDQDGTWHRGRPSSGLHCARWDPAPSTKKRVEARIFDPFLLWPNGLLDQDATWYGGRPQPSRLCVRWVPISPVP